MSVMNARCHPSRRITTATAALAAAAVVLGTVSGCSSDSSSGGAGAAGKLDVVASFYPMEYLAERIGGEHVAVTPLTKAGVEPHDLEIKPQQQARLGEADMVLYLKGLQPAVDKAVGEAKVRNTVDAASLTSLEKHGSEVGHDGHEKGHESHDEGHGEGGHDHGSEGGNGSDPHIWLDPVKYAEVAKGVGKALEKADPDHAADYRKNTDALVKDLGDLDKSFADGLRNTETKTFITAHSAFGYLAERYGLVQEAISGLDPESEPSPARVKELQETAKKDKVTTVFFETLAGDRMVKSLAADTGLKTDVLDPVEGITDSSRGDDYLAVMRANLTALRTALGAK
ncbi:metal ABC transporter substrate-binding protein [Streptomyces sp. URMC 123]|uniref:metal ABC transporter substrate-binding protein n=1 Tax=Streptomyces sp. URMC 123 TaxID=3423403 RepID=UPI003F1C96C0